MKRFSLVLLALLFPSSVASAQMKAHFINVGQAESILLEFKTAAVLIDAGGEDTGDPRTSQGARDRDRLIGYLTRFFDRRKDLNRTLHSIIISHPHIDHTRLLMNVMRRFRVRNLVDGGGRSGSGIGPLREARQRAAARNIVYNKVSDARIGDGGYTPFMLGQLLDSDSRADIRFLSGGGRDCDDQNNNSLTVRVEHRGRKFIFTGDSEEEDSTCVGGQIARLLERFDNASHTGLLDVDVYKVGHHGSGNATNEELLEAMSPAVAVISAGDEATRSPGQFHAFFFGHPRESAVRMIEEGLTDSRQPPTNSYTLRAVRRVVRPRPVSKALYCTCWDGNIVVSVDSNGNLTPEVNQ